MIRPRHLIDCLSSYGIDFYAGVPDSLLKQLCACLTDTLPAEQHIIAANEGGAIGLAAGHYLATGRIPVVYMQNSGEGNTINPLTSLTDKDVYGLPVLLLIGWRGKPGVHDEPQHVKQGKITIPLLEVLGIRYVVLSHDEDVADSQVEDAVRYMQSTGESYALVVEKDTFESYESQVAASGRPFPMSREDAIHLVAASMGERDIVVSTTGMISRELFEYRVTKRQGHERDFLTVGSMGHASQIALGIALAQSKRRVYCFDGDGAVLMHMGAMAIVAQMAPKNFVHVVFNNGAHDSVGGQPTVGLAINLPQVAQAVGYNHVFSAVTEGELVTCLEEMNGIDGPVFLQICVRKGNRKDLGRPTTTPVENKEALMKFLKS